MYGNWAADEEAFLVFIETCLAPNLQPGEIVVMDNVPFHKTDAVREAIKKAHADVVFLPPYSPDLSPIENMGSKLKNYLKRKAA